MVIRARKSAAAWQRSSSVPGLMSCGMRWRRSLERALASPSAGLRTEVAGVLRAVDAVRVALGATVETAVWQSGERIQAELMAGSVTQGRGSPSSAGTPGQFSDQVAEYGRIPAEIELERGPCQRSSS